MNRDNILFTVGGLLVGFIVGYIGHELMQERQPARLIAGSAAATAAPATAGNPPAASPAAAMERVQRLRAHVEANPDDHESVLLLANMNYEIRNWSRAAELFKHYNTLAPGDPEAMTDLGLCLRALGDSQGALELFNRVETLAPDYWQAYFNEIIVLAFDLGDLERAVVELAVLQQLVPENSDVQRLAAEVEQRQQG